MEQKKTLGITLSAGVFLLVVLGVALVMNSFGMKKDVPALSLKDSGQIWISPNSSSHLGNFTAPAQNVGTSSEGSNMLLELIDSQDNTGANSSGISGSYTPSTTQGNASASNGGFEIIDGSTDFNLTNSASASQSNVIAKNDAAEKAMKDAENAKKSEVAASAKPAASSAKTSTSKASATAKTPSAGTSSAIAPAKANSAVSSSAHYWVQVASYSTKSNADEARAVLDKNAMPCEVFTFTKDNALYYRVRVGPYTTKSEADYWKKQVDSIDLFKSAGSLVVDSSAKKN